MYSNTELVPKIKKVSTVGVV